MPRHNVERSLDRATASSRNLVRFGLRGLYRFEVHNAARVPTAGRVILAATNVAAFDPIALFSCAPRPVHVLVDDHLYLPPLAGALRAAGQIRILPNCPDRIAMSAAIEELARERAVGIFPEAERGDGSFASIRHGIAYLQSRTNAPIVPVAIFGTRPRSDNLDDFPKPRSVIRVFFGNPFAVPVVGDIDYRGTLASIGETIRQRLADHVVACSAELGQGLTSITRGSND